MSEKKFDIYLNIAFNKLSICIFIKFTGQILFFKEYECLTSLNKNKLDFQNLDKILQNNIFEIEKITGSFLNDIYLMLDTPETTSVSLSLTKDNEGKKILKKNVQYLVQDAKQQVLRSYLNKNIIHIIVSSYMVDGIFYQSLPEGKNCKNFSVDIRFICFPKYLVNKVEKLFNNHQILINKIICSNYAKEFVSINRELNICEIGYKLNQGLNNQEVKMIPKKIEKKGFFERLFHLFN